MLLEITLYLNKVRLYNVNVRNLFSGYTAENQYRIADWMPFSGEWTIK